ncbi:MAG: nucleoside phosphorylase [Bdellovibrionales bacterium]|nr:nucleoside phosphorylase [Bdellovibrionales bacterium]
MPFPRRADKWRLPGYIQPEKMISYLQNQGQLQYDSPESVVIIYSSGFAKQVQEEDEVDVRPFMGGRLGFFKKFDHRLATLSGFGIGAPAVAAKIEELAAFGVKRFFAIGTCGALNPHLAIGSVVLCEKALREEGTSHHYLPPEAEAESDSLLLRRAETEIKHLGIAIPRTTTWTIDSPYRETREEIAEFAAQGISVVDMEAAAAFAAARYRQVPLACLLVVSDRLTTPEWDPQFHVGPVKVGMNLAWQVAVATLRH